MADDKTKRGTPDRSRVAGGEKYEVDYVAQKMGVSQQAVRDAIKHAGNGRKAVEDYIKKHK